MRKTAMAASGFALVLALTACGGDDGGSNDSAVGGGEAGTNLFTDPAKLAEAASQQTAASKSSKFTMQMNMAGQQMSAQGEGSYAGENTAVAMTMDMAGQQMEMRFVDQTMYMKLPQQLSAQTGGKPWVKISAEGTDPLSQQLGGQLDQMAAQSDPSKSLEYVKQAGNIVSSEETTLDGQQVTHYTVELDFKKIADQMAAGGLTQEQIAQLSGKIDKLPMQLWLNSDQLPVQVSMDMTKIMEAAGAGNQKAEMVMKYTDWGAPVNVEAPPASEVGELPSN
ncbi:hypothetical protein ACFS2C_21335 [Prauserella oleivorans]|uniref:LppX_LprAFG lipoprotein n=1 Tax=Prauserella oleivorans TaxID=1478153 RepID=A0ABW5WFV6_9PSEU